MRFTLYSHVITGYNEIHTVFTCYHRLYSKNDWMRSLSITWMCFTTSNRKRKASNSVTFTKSSELKESWATLNLFTTRGLCKVKKKSQQHVVILHVYNDDCMPLLCLHVIMSRLFSYPLFLTIGRRGSTFHWPSTINLICKIKWKYWEAHHLRRAVRMWKHNQVDEYHVPHICLGTTSSLRKRYLYLTSPSFSAK